MTIQAVKNLSNPRVSDPDAQGLSPMSADSARFAKTLNTLQADDDASHQPVSVDAVRATSNVNDLGRKPNATEPIRESSARNDVIAKSPLTPAGELTQKARELVGATFFATLLKQMHDSPFKSELFSGGRGGEAFGGMYDQVLSQRMAQRNADRIVRPIVKKFKAAADAAYERQNNKKQSLNEAKSNVPSNLRA